MNWDYVELMGMHYAREEFMVGHQRNDPPFPNPKQGDWLFLTREPFNKYDPNAIRIENKGVKIGYIERKAADRLAPLMDKGEVIYFACAMGMSNEGRFILKIRGKTIKAKEV